MSPRRTATGLPAGAARRKIARRILPYLFFLYILSYVDRANVAFANRPMSAGLGFSEAVFGFGAGIFFVGYFVLQIPGALLVERWSARRLIAGILVAWGIVTVLIGFVQTPAQFYAGRFLLGAAEAGFFPGVLVYLTHWFTAGDRARATAKFAVAAPVALTIGAPISSVILKLDWLGLPGWRWIFILQGLPAMLFGAITLFYLADRPRDAKWLSPEEAGWIADELRRELERKRGGGSDRWWRALGSCEVLLLTGASFCANMAGYGFILWLPNTLNRGLGFPLLISTALAALPFVAAVIASLLVGRSSDRTGERKWHACGSFLAAGVFLALASFRMQPVAFSVLWICLTGAAAYSWVPPFWVLPSLILGESEAAASIGMINSVGNLGGFAGPFLAGYLLSRGSSYGSVLLMLAAAYCLSAFFTLLLRVHPADGR